MRLQDKVAIITGGGSGLGKESSLLFAKEGAIVVVADFNENASQEVVNEIIAAGGQALSVKVNVAVREDVDAMVQTVIDTYGRIDILINNAGITQDKTLLKMTQDQWQNVINVNLTGVFNCTSAAAPHMVANGFGRIITTSSIVGTSGNVGQTNYAAAKAGVIGMTKSWAKELGRKGVTANAVAPGFISTPMTEKMPENVLEGMRNMVPLQRLGEARDVAEAYLYLASDAGKYVNGTVIEVDGGLSL